jgi:hypothetical protein
MNSCTVSRRVDASGRAFAGSQRHIQALVNADPDRLSAEILRILPSLGALGPTARWVSPLAVDSYHEYRDAEFLRAVGLGDRIGELQQFWPRRGP